MENKIKALRGNRVEMAFNSSEEMGDFLIERLSAKKEMTFGERIERPAKRVGRPPGAKNKVKVAKQ